MLRALDSYRATIETKRDIVLDSAPGIEFRGVLLDGQEGADAGTVYGRVYLFDSRIYQLTVLAPKGQTDTTAPDRFLSSFRWLNPDARLP